jgi:hypothetical protein
MEKKEAKLKIKKQLWSWGYHAVDMERVMPGFPCDLTVKLNKDSDCFYRVKVLTGEEDMDKELKALAKARKKFEYDVIAIAGKKNKYAGGAQEEYLFTTKHQEVFR